MDSLHLMSKQGERLGVLLASWAPCCPAASLTIMLGNPRISVPAAAALVVLPWNFMVYMTTMGLPQVVTGPGHGVGQTINLVFAPFD